ncbi:MAG: glycosyltransferase family 2 protein [Candidatus Shapirobacteria bacterium]|jgi:hypothetical protein
MTPTLSIVILSYNTRSLTLNCLNSITKDKNLAIAGFTPPNRRPSSTPTEIIVVDNASTDDSVAYLKKISFIKLIINKKNQGFSAGNNQGLAHASGNYLLFLNSDTVILHSAISQALDWLSSHPEANACSAQLLNADKSIQIAGGFLPNLANILTWITGLDDLPLVNTLIPPFHPHPPSFYTHDRFYLKDRQLEWLHGAFILIRTASIKNIAGFDSNYFMYGEEIDLFYRLKLSGQASNRYLIGPQIIHFGGASSSTKSFPLSREYQGLLYFFKKHKPEWQYQLVKILFKFNPTLYLRALFFSICGKKEKARSYFDTISQI